MTIGRTEFRMRIGIVGLGNVGLALGRGLHLAGHQAQTIGCDRNLEKREKFTQTTGIRACEDWEQAVEFSDFILVCVRHPQIIPFLDDLRHSTHSGKTVVCLAAAVSLADLKEGLRPSEMSLTRAITNVNVASRSGLTMVLRDQIPIERDTSAGVVSLFQGLGEVIITDSEVDLDRLSVLSGCGPAAIAIFLEALSEFGIRAGFDPEVAKNVALQCVSASIRTLEHTNSDLKAYKYSVAAPGGIVHKLLGAPESRQIDTSVVEWFDYILRRIEQRA